MQHFLVGWLEVTSDVRGPFARLLLLWTFPPSHPLSSLLCCSLSLSSPSLFALLIIILVFHPFHHFSRDSWYLHCSLLSPPFWYPALKSNCPTRCHPFYTPCLMCKGVCMCLCIWKWVTVCIRACVCVCVWCLCPQSQQTQHISFL